MDVLFTDVTKVNLIENSIDQRSVNFFLRASPLLGTNRRKLYGKKIEEETSSLLFQRKQISAKRTQKTLADVDFPKMFLLKKTSNNKQRSKTEETKRIKMIKLKEELFFFPF